MSDMLSELEIVAASIPTDPLKCGVYFLIDDDKVMYVGKSVDIHARLIEHRRSGKVFERWHWIPCPREALDDLERSYLDTFLPKWNLDTETRRKRGDVRPLRDIDIPREKVVYTFPLPAPLLPNPWEDVPPTPPEELVEILAEIGENDQERRERMLRVRAMRKCHTDSEMPIDTDQNQGNPPLATEHEHCGSQ
jgi:hypothetical protein